MLDDLHRSLRHTSWSLLLRGLLALSVGIFIFFRPLQSIDAFALLIAFWALVTGFIYIVHAIEVKSVMRHWWLLLLSGLVSAGFGIAALMYYPVLSLAFAVVWVAWWLMVAGLLEVYGAVLMRQLGGSWIWAAVFGALSIAAAAFALLVPPATLGAIMGLISGFAVVVGIALVVGAVRVRGELRP